jgi:ankyrin repeat protein
MIKYITQKLCDAIKENDIQKVKDLLFEYEDNHNPDCENEDYILDTEKVVVITTKLGYFDILVEIFKTFSEFEFKDLRAYNMFYIHNMSNREDDKYIYYLFNILNDNLSVVDSLLDFKPDFFSPNDIHTIVSKGHINLVKKLITSGCIKNDEHSFIIAIRFNQLEIAKLLIEYTDKKTREYATRQAVYWKNDKCLEFLLSYVDNVDSDLLRLSAKRYSYENFKMLLDDGRAVPDAILVKYIINKRFDGLISLLWKDSRVDTILQDIDKSNFLEVIDWARESITWRSCVGSDSDNDDPDLN